ncbi:MAG: Gfo/Idh/MocA family oxidoreductase [Armatimonadetes bacterium]|nr:Gfo/Idh/MocA family oxidoreductase [Armatimonadota bacterium]
MSLKIGVAGLRRGTGPALVLKQHAECELTAVCDLFPGRAEAFAKQHGVAQWFDDYTAFCAADLDAIVVATPAPVHVACAVEAMRAGKHVLSEVPACWDLDQARELVRVVRETGLKYMFGENMCYFAYCQSYGEMVRRGDIGEVIYVEGEYIHNCDSLMTETGPDGQPRLTWRTRMPPIQYCTHELGPILQWLDDRIVSATGLSTGCWRKPEWGVTDMEVGLFRTAKGVIVKVLCGFSVAKEPAHHWFTLYGTRGHLESPRWPDGQHRLQSDLVPYMTEHARLSLGINHPGAPPEATVGGHGTSEYFMCNDFVRCILDDTKPAIDVYQGLDMTLPGICAHLSAERGGELVEVPDPRDW